MKGLVPIRLDRDSIFRIFALIFLVVLLFVGVLAVAFRVSGEADSAIVGVKPGDWVKYSVTRLGDNLVWVYSEAVWVKVEVLNVSGTTVTVRETVHDEDGSESIRNFSSNLPVHDYYIIAANLGPGDKVDTIPVETEINKWVYADLTLNDTDYRSYGGVTREVNLLRWSQNDTHFWNMANYTSEICWDKATGFLLEEKFQGYLIGYEEWYESHQPSTYKMEIVDTNMWKMEKPPQQPWWWLAVIPVGAVIAVAVTVKLRNNRKKNENEKT